MIYIHSLGRACRHYTQRTALVVDGAAVSFKALEERVRNIAAALAANGFAAGDRLALLLPNSPEYIELVYACSWLGVTAVPINARLSAAEIDRVLLDAKPRGLLRHSSLPRPAVQLQWHIVLDEKPFDVRNERALAYLFSANLSRRTGTGRAIQPAFRSVASTKPRRRLLP
jgi:acyl-CoA synthetase (AMP-forming)/AMP-acid ligase II